MTIRALATESDFQLISLLWSQIQSNKKKKLTFILKSALFILQAHYTTDLSLIFQISYGNVE